MLSGRLRQLLPFLETRDIVETFWPERHIPLIIWIISLKPTEKTETTGDAALMMELGADGVFVGSGIFKSETPEKFANAIVQATANYKDYDLIGKLSKDLGTPMKGIDVATLASEERMQERGW